MKISQAALHFWKGFLTVAQGSAVVSKGEFTWQTLTFAIIASLLGGLTTLESYNTTPSVQQTTDINLSKMKSTLIVILIGTILLTSFSGCDTLTTTANGKTQTTSTFNPDKAAAAEALAIKTANDALVVVNEAQALQKTQKAVTPNVAPASAVNPTQVK